MSANLFLKWCLSSSRAYKTIEDDDLKFPLIYGEGKKVGSHSSWNERGVWSPMYSEPVACLSWNEGVSEALSTLSLWRVHPGMRGMSGALCTLSLWPFVCVTQWFGILLP